MSIENELSEQPQKTEPSSLKEVLSPSHTVLLVVDMQNDFLSDGGFFAKNQQIVGGDYRQMQSIVPNVQGMIDAARKAGMPIIFTKGYEDVKFRTGPDLFRALQWKEKDGDGSVNSESGTLGAEFYPGIEPREGEVVVEKNRWSSFSGREQKSGAPYDPNDKTRRTLQEILDQMGVRTLVITGVVAETCIETTVRDAYEKGFFVVIPENSVSSNHEDQLKARKEYWAKGFVGNVLSEEEIKSYWDQSQTVSDTEN